MAQNKLTGAYGKTLVQLAVDGAINWCEKHEPYDVPHCLKTFKDMGLQYTIDVLSEEGKLPPIDLGSSIGAERLKKRFSTLMKYYINYYNDNYGDYNENENWNEEGGCCNEQY